MFERNTISNFFLTPFKP
uniref:Uncharacterized protein n=1 Tax=Anguilla anguilla TaxID=7936 RepID=A0A0E9U7K4_ANGAN